VFRSHYSIWLPARKKGKALATPDNISARTLYRVPAQAMKKKSKFLSFLIGYKVSWYRVH